MAFNFARQNAVGKEGEALLRDHYHAGPLKKLAEKNATADFLTQDNLTVEIKTDTYPMARTENFFMEFYSDEKKKTLGGPWRSFDRGTDILIYLFVTDKVYFEFRDLQKLVFRLDDIIKKKKLKPQGILNQGYVTVGYKVPRELVKDLFTEHSIDMLASSAGSTEHRIEQVTAPATEQLVEVNILSVIPVVSKKTTKQAKVPAKKGRIAKQEVVGELPTLPIAS